MKILFSEESSVAYAAYRLTSYLNTHTEHQARILCNRKIQNLKNSSYGCLIDDTVPIYTMEAARECVEWADVIHCFWRHSPKVLGAEDLIDKKIWVYGWIGFTTVEATFNKIWAGIDLKKIKFQHTIHGHDEHPFFQNIKKNYRYKNLPRFIDIHQPWFKPVPMHKKRNVVGFYPTYADRPKTLMTFDGKVKSVWHKGWKEIKKAVGDLPVETRLYNTPYKDIIQLKASNILNLDDILSPYLSNFAFESIGAGTPCISAISNYALNQVTTALECDYTPFINTKLMALKETIAGYLNEDLSHFSNNCHIWMQKYYSPERIAQMYIDYYQED
jgi:glycosyltransferase involved in cell wall biosynthesis